MSTTFGQQFTICENTDGRPVQRALGAMTGDEVLAAMKWQDDRAKRLAPAAKRARAVADAVETDVGAESVTRDQLLQAIEALRAYAAEEQRAVDLLRLISAAMPQWGRCPSMRLAVAVRKFWPR